MEKELVFSHVEVTGIAQSIMASGYPMQAEQEYRGHLNEGDYSRARGLSSAKPGSGHDCFLKGIIVQFDLLAPEFFWRQLDRYHFIDYVSSQSKMHRILKFDLKAMCNSDVEDSILHQVAILIDDYNDLHDNGGSREELRKAFHKIISNTPMGLRMTARMTTNYLQLKSIYNQRKNHKLPEWEEFREFIENLPFSEYITGGK